MLATTTLTWTLLIASFAPAQQNHMTAATSIAGFGSPQACQIALELAQEAIDAHGGFQPLIMCVPVDSARPLPAGLENLHEFIKQN